MRDPKEGPCEPIAPLELPHSLHVFHRVSSSDSLNVEGYHTFRGGFWNYFSMGMNAEVSYAFHSERRRNPEKFKNQLANQGTYAKLGIKQGWFFASISHPSSRNIPQFAKVKIMKGPGSQWEELQIHHSIPSIACLNLPSCSGGLNPWGIPGTRRADDREFTAPYVDDSLLEVVGFRDAWHGLVLLAPNGHGHRLAQPLPKDDDTVVVEISYLGQVPMLANEPCKSKSVDDPSSQSHHHDEGDTKDDAVDEEWEDGKRKFGAADTFKIPDEIDIAHLS